MNIFTRKAAAGKRAVFGVNLIVTQSVQIKQSDITENICRMFLNSTVPVRIIKVMPYDSQSISRCVKKLRYSINVFVCSPEEIPSVDVREFSTDETVHNILFFLWELVRPTALMLQSFQKYDEIWFPSEDQRDETASLCDIKCVYVPVIPGDRKIKQKTRGYFGLPEFSFLVFCEINGDYCELHNIKGVAEAFRKAFPPHDISAFLVIRINGDENSCREVLATELEGFQNYKIFGNSMLSDSGESLEKCCDTVISLRKSTAYDVSVHKAMKNGIPVIAPAFFSNAELISQSTACKVEFTEKLDMITYCDISTSSLVCEPDLVQTAVYMKILKCDMHYRRQIGESGGSFYRKYRTNSEKSISLDRLLHRYS